MYHRLSSVFVSYSYYNNLWVVDAAKGESVSCIIEYHQYLYHIHTITELVGGGCG